MVIMSLENYEYTMQKINMYENIEYSEKQIKGGKVKEAAEALSGLGERR